MTISFSGGDVHPASVITVQDSTYCLIRLHGSGEQRLGVMGNAADFENGTQGGGLFHFPLTPYNAVVLRSRIAWLNPTPVGLRTSFGFGDRMGLATPGHIDALCGCDPVGRVAPIFAQQSVRENTRTGRTPQQVMDEAMWSVFQEGWREAWGADADHIKEIADLAPFIEAGYTFFTIDPSDYVDQGDGQEANDPAFVERYLAQPFNLDGLTIKFDQSILNRAMAKYGRAITHAVSIANELASRLGGKPFDLELSVDETDTPTSIYEHFLIVNELIRNEVPITSLAPRFVGKFQKGVDYIGDVAEFEADFVQHAAIMHHFGSYKLSIHTGSDKFSLYPIIARHTKGQVHVKTAGTSYLEALRVASHQPDLFRRILDVAHERFEKDRKTYFLDAQLSRVPTSGSLVDADLPALLDQFDARQVLHVSFGSILDAFGTDLRDLLTTHEVEYRAALNAHFARHIAPFV